jgi:hypothetical protein
MLVRLRMPSEHISCAWLAREGRELRNYKGGAKLFTKLVLVTVSDILQMMDCIQAVRLMNNFCFIFGTIRLNFAVFPTCFELKSSNYNICCYSRCFA